MPSVTRLLLAFALLSWQAAALEQGETASPPPDEGVPRVALSEITGNPGQSLMIPMYFTPDPQNPLRSFTVEIEFVSNSLKFQSAEPGDVLAAAGAKMEAALSEGKLDDKGVTRSKLRVSVALTEKQPQQGLPEGLAAYLLFELSTKAKPFAIKMATTVVNAEDLQNPPHKFTKLIAKSGTVLVELADTNPEANCFFFTH
jgi:hypothetical protein